MISCAPGLLLISEGPLSVAPDHVSLGFRCSQMALVCVYVCGSEKGQRASLWVLVSSVSGAATACPTESQSVTNGANPAVIRLEDLSDVLQMSHLVTLCIHFITAVS